MLDDNWQPEYTCPQIIPMGRQTSNQQERAQWAQRRHVSVYHLCVLGVLCGYNNKLVSLDLSDTTKRGATALRRISASSVGTPFCASAAHYDL